MDIISVLGLIALLSFYGSYFTKSLFLHRKGIFADRMGRGVKPARTVKIEHMLKLATFSMAVIQSLILFETDDRYLLIQNEAIRYVGLVISFIGTSIFITAMITMKSSWRAGVDASQQTKLIRHGIYRISRNPAFLGFDVFYIGFTLTFCHPVQVLFMIFCITILHLQIIEEEKFLPTIFAQEYLDYKKSVARYLLFK